jgi:large subunit ribosomal protein L25
MPEGKGQMISQEVVTATPREGKFNKNAARRVRARGRIPAVVYGAAEPSVAIEVDPKQIARILHSDAGHNSIFDLEIGAANGNGVAKAKAMIVDWQYEPIKGALLHIDLKRIALDKVIRVEVPIQLTGVASGVKNEGGILDQVMREIEIECLPGDIPSHIDVDVTNMAFGDVLRVADLPNSYKVEFLVDDDATVAHVTSVKEEAAPAPEAEAAAAAAPAEPEVAKKGKQETAEAAPAAKK